MSYLKEHSASWPERRVRHYGPLSVGQVAYYSRSGSRGRPDVAGEFEIVSLGKCESGVIVDMTDGHHQVRTHAWVNGATEHYWVDLRETFRVLRAAPAQAELRI